MDADFYMININVADLDTSVRFYAQLGFEEILRMDITNPTVGESYGVENFELCRAAWMRLGSESPRRWPIIDLVEFVDPPMLEDPPGDTRRRRGPSRISFRVDTHEEVERMHQEALEQGIDIAAPYVRREAPGTVVAMFWMRDPDGTILEVIHVERA